MKLIVGLGNPGSIYAESRHNIGYSVIKALAREYGGSLKKENRVAALSGKFRTGNDYAILALPLTFMNLSGSPVSSLIKKYKIDLDDLLVICDDLDLGFGRIRIKDAGSSAGHRGIQSIIAALKSAHFCRLRIGIGRPCDDAGISDYVLAPFAKEEKKKVKEIIEKAAECCRIWVSQGISKSMETFNRRKG